MPEAPKIYDVSITDTEQGVTLRFSLDEGLEDTNEQSLWCRARIKGSSYYQPLDLNILSGGKTAEATIEAGKVQDNYLVDLQWYLETYPEREKSELVEKTVPFTPDWFNLTAFERETRSAFEVRGIEMQAQEACRFRLVTPEEAQQFNHAALDNNVGLWILEGSIGDDGLPEVAGIAPDQPDMGQAWLAAWIPQVLERSREIRTENGWDDDRNH